MTQLWPMNCKENSTGRLLGEVSSLLGKRPAPRVVTFLDGTPGTAALLNTYCVPGLC